MARRILNVARGADPFLLFLAASIFFHGIAYGAYRISSARGGDTVMDASEISAQEIEIDFTEIPPELAIGASDPAPVIREEWVEGSSRDAPDAPEGDETVNALSGEGTDADGYLFAYRGDRYPEPIIDFDLRDYFPAAAREAGVAGERVVLLVQINENGSLKSARVASEPAGYGFDEAALRVARRMRFRPGYVKGKPVKMVCKLPITFSLER